MIEVSSSKGSSVSLVAEGGRVVRTGYCYRCGREPGDFLVQLLLRGHQEATFLAKSIYLRQTIALLHYIWKKSHLGPDFLWKKKEDLVQNDVVYPRILLGFLGHFAVLAFFFLWGFFYYFYLSFCFFLIFIIW